MATVNGQAREWNVANEEYHRDTSAVSNSALGVFRKSPSQYHRQYVLGVEPRPEPSLEMRQGSWLHVAVLEPESWARDFCVSPKFDRRTTAGKNNHAAWLADNADKTAVDAESHHLVELWREAIYANRIARELLERDGVVEHSIVWQDEATGIMRKCRRDKVVGNLTIDLKTTRDVRPQEFSKTCHSFGYHRQAAWYMDGHEALTGCPAEFVFIAIAKDSLEVATYQPRPSALQLGRDENRTLLKRLARHRQRDSWQAAYETQILEIDLPAYAYQQSANWEVPDDDDAD